MPKNIMKIERIVRIVAAGVVAVLVLTNSLTGLTALFVGILAILLFVTGTIAYCPVYSLFRTQNKGSQ